MNQRTYGLFLVTAGLLIMTVTGVCSATAARGVGEVAFVGVIPFILGFCVFMFGIQAINRKTPKDKSWKPKDSK